MRVAVSEMLMLTVIGKWSRRSYKGSISWKCFALYRISFARLKMECLDVAYPRESKAERLDNSEACHWPIAAPDVRDGTSAVGGSGLTAPRRRIRV